MKIASVDTALTSRETELLQQVMRIEQTKKTQLKETAEDLQSLGKSLTGCIEDMEQALAKTDPYDFLEAAAAVEVRVHVTTPSPSVNALSATPHPCKRCREPFNRSIQRDITSTAAVAALPCHILAAGMHAAARW